MFHLLFYLVWITCILTALKPTVIVSNLRINPVKTLHELLITHGCEQSKRIREKKLYSKELGELSTASYGLHSK